MLIARSREFTVQALHRSIYTELGSAVTKQKRTILISVITIHIHHPRFTFISFSRRKEKMLRAFPSRPPSRFVLLIVMMLLDVTTIGGICRTITLPIVSLQSNQSTIFLLGPQLIHFSGKEQSDSKHASCAIKGKNSLNFKSFYRALSRARADSTRLGSMATGQSQSVCTGRNGLDINFQLLVASYIELISRGP